MKKINYTIDDKTIASILGMQNFLNCYSAILELIKNAYDAASSTVDIYFFNNSIVIQDYGIGMDETDIIHKWMRVGNSDKEYKILIEQTGKERVTAGAKGIGRFAIARLGSRAEMFTKKVACPGLHWKTDWNTSEYEIDYNVKTCGTRIQIEELRDQWDFDELKKLSIYLGLVCNQSDMVINLYHNNTIIPISFYYSNPQFGVTHVAQIALDYNADTTKLSVSINSDEFAKEASNYCKNIDLNKHIVDFDVQEQLKFDESILHKVGSFKASFFFSLRLNAKNDEQERFCYKYGVLPNRYTKKVCLYRNAFSISGYDGTKDWLDMNSRMRKSPAAATHPHGSWRIRDNQLSGFVLIDKERNAYITELSNRQGIEENVFFTCLKEIILLGIAEFERYRQSIIKLINVKNDVIDADLDLLYQVYNNEITYKNLNKNNWPVFQHAVKENYLRISKLEQDIEDLRYDNRILNTLSTIGLKAASIAHELKGEKTNIGSFVGNIRNALIKLNLWNSFDDYKNNVAYDVPFILDRMEKTSVKLYSFLGVMVDDTSKKRFTSPTNNFEQFMLKLKKDWQFDYAKLLINYKLPPKNNFKISEDVFQTIFDNLLLNSIQQNSEKSKISVEINVDYNDDNHKLYIIYKDDGVGLASKYSSNPWRILEVHETTRENGHGLGMWIVNSTVLATGGEIATISKGPGFLIEFTLGDK